MQRLCAVLLVSCFSALLGLPAFLSPVASQVPECCRRIGVHKCAMRAAGAATDSEPSFAARCPFAKITRAEAVLPISWLPGPVQIYFGQLLSHPAAQPQTEARYRCSSLRSRQKRGPPSPLA